MVVAVGLIVLLYVESVYRWSVLVTVNVVGTVTGVGQMVLLSFSLCRPVKACLSTFKSGRERASAFGPGTGKARQRGVKRA
jgi:hypothetical protein